MGWWHFGVMDGDTPCDIAVFLKERLIGECRSHTPRGQEAYLAKFNEALKETANVENLMASLPDCKRRMLEDDDEPHFWQVLGVLCMQAGGRIDPFKDKLLDAISLDPFSERSGDRRKAMDTFLQQVEAYRNAPILIKQTSLFGAMDEMHGAPGLINK